MRRNDPRVLAQWRERLDRFDASQLALAGFCQSEGITSSAFYYWRRKLSQLPPTSVERPDSAPKSSFLPVKVASAAEVEFTFPNGTTMRLPPGDPQLLKMVMDAVARLDFDHGGD